MSPSHTYSPTLKRWLVTFGRVYLVLLAGWLLAYLLGGDWSGLLTPLNALAPLLFIPLPLVLLLGLLGRQRELLAGSLLAALVFSYFWGGLLLPGPQPAGARQGRSTAAGQPGEVGTLRVKTMNVFGFNFEAASVIQVIRQTDPDVVCFQELNPLIARALQSELGGSYPYQVLDARPGVTGMGVISKHPLQPAPEGLPSEWIGQPQTLDLLWSGQTIRLVNYHMSTPGRLSPRSLLAHYPRRQQQAADLAAYASRVGTPLILAGDSNSAELNDAYRTLTGGGLRDAWRAAGLGLGFTFPRHLGRLQPAWMTRIDHVFVSAEWGIVQAQLAPTVPGSDHRGVLIELQLPGH